MKRFIKCALSVSLVLALLLPLCACSVSDNEPTNQGAQPPKAEASDLKTNAKPVLNKVFDYTTGYNINIKFNKDNFFVDYCEGSGENRSDYLIENSYNIENDTITKIGKRNTFIASSGAEVIMENAKYLWYNTADENGREICRLIKVDGDNKEVTVLGEKEFKHLQLLRLNKLSETQFISTYYTDDGVSTFTVIDIYDTREEKMKNLFTLKYTNVKEKPDSTGTVLEAMCAMDNKIYGIGREKHNSEYECYFYIFDTNGKLIKKINAPVLNEALADTAPLRLHVINNYFEITDHSMKASLYKIDGDKITCVVAPDEGYAFALGYENAYSSEKSPYLYYYKPGWQIDEESRYLYIFDTVNGKEIKTEVMFDDNYRSLDYVATDEEGNVLICFDKDRNKFDYKYYYIDFEDIKAYAETSK